MTVSLGSGVRRFRLFALVVLSAPPALAGAAIIGGSPSGECFVENGYGASMAVLHGRHLVVGSTGQFCSFVHVLDSATGEAVWAVRDLDDVRFGSPVAAVGRDVLVADIASEQGYALRALRIEPATATVRAAYEVPGLFASIDAIVAVSRRVAVLDTGTSMGAIHVFDAESGAPRRTIPNPDPGYTLGRVLARVGRRLVIASARPGDSRVSILGLESGTVHAVVGSREPADRFGSAIVAGGTLVAVGAPGTAGGRGAVYLFDRRGRERGTIHPEPDAGCFGEAVAVQRGAVLVGAPCTTLRHGEEGAAFLYSARTGALLARYDGRELEKLGSSVALLPASVALAGRGPDTADNGFVRLAPR